MKNKGTLYEQTFFTEALFRNLHVFPPVGDYLPIDCLVMNDAGKVFKVQIKGTENKITPSPKPSMNATWRIGTTSNDKELHLR